MKIWFPVIRGGSGTDVFTRRLASALRTHGFETEITWFPSQYELAPAMLGGVEPPRGTKVIHANTWNGFAFRRRGIPLVVTEHLGGFDTSTAAFRTRAQRLYHSICIKRYVRKSARAADTVTAVSRFAANELERLTGIKAVHVIHNGIDTRKFSPVSPSLLKSESQPRRLLFVGNLTKRKGADLLVPIMHRLGPGFVLYLASGLRSTNRTRLGPSIIDIGRVEDDNRMAQLYRENDCLLFPTRLEGFGLAALEAMSCGLPVIASENSAVPEVVEDQVSGLLCQTDDVNSFADAVLRLHRNPELRASLSRAARRRAVELYDERDKALEYAALYRSLVE